MTRARRLLTVSVALVAVLWLAVPAGRFALALVVLLFCPGYLAERRLLRGAGLPGSARLAVWLGLGVSAVALLYHWVAALGLALAPQVVAGFVGLCALAAAWDAWRETGHRRSAIDHGRPTTDDRQPTTDERRPTADDRPPITDDLERPVTDDRPPATDRLWAIVTILVLALTLWTRFEHVRELAAPAWVDSLHHALLIRVAAERGQAPYDLEPYLPIAGLTYHSGYHSFIAAAVAASGGLCAPGDAAGCGVALPEAMLLSGQLLNALAALAWAGAARTLWRSPVAAATAALVVGLASIMPAFYVSWGRYTLVTGVAMLPAVIIMAHLIAAGRGGPGGAGYGRLAALGVLLAGLSLVHFVVLCLALLWCAAVVAVSRAPLRGGLRFAVAGLFALLLTAPWVAMLLAQVRLTSGSSAMNAAGNAWYNAMPEGLLWASSNRLLVALAGIGGLVATRARQPVAAALALWVALIALSANPALLGLPYLSFFTNEFVAITLFAPVSLLIAGGAVTLYDATGSLLRADCSRPTVTGMYRARRAFRRWYGTLAAACLFALAGWCAWQLRSVIRPDTVLAAEADLRAIAWAAEETAPDARFVVNTAGWLGDVDRGADGGWWLLPLAGRGVSTPPVVFNYGPEAYSAAVKEQTAWLRGGEGANPAALADFMRRHDYEYVYTTARGTSVDAGRLSASPLFDPVYSDGDVRIFRLAP
jgi:hypothetical protein